MDNVKWWWDISAQNELFNVEEITKRILEDIFGYKDALSFLVNEKEDLPLDLPQIPIEDFIWAHRDKEAG